MCDMYPKDEYYSWLTIVCKKPVISKLFYKLETCASGEGTVIDVRYDFACGRFKANKSRRSYATIYTICFNEKTMNPYYTRNKIRSCRKNLDLELHETFITETAIHLPLTIKQIHTVYSKSYQKATISAQLGINKSFEQYIYDDDRHYLVPSFLTSPRDFSHPALIKTTYRYFNVAPLWKGLANWQEIENEVYDYSFRHLDVLTTYTGIYERQPFSTDVQLFLYNEDGKQFLPIPELFWKILYLPYHKSAVVFVLINNPYTVSPKKICTDVSNFTGWLSFRHKEIPDYGYAYTCSFEDFKSVVTYAPDILANKLLMRY